MYQAHNMIISYASVLGEIWLLPVFYEARIKESLLFGQLPRLDKLRRFDFI